MPRRRSKRTFIKIKQKLVLVPPKKLLGRKALGVCFLILGSLILAFSFAYFYLFPRFFLRQPKIVEIERQERAFLPERIIMPEIDLDLEVKEGSIEGKMIASVMKIKKGEEILVLGQENRYQKYKVINTEIKESSSAGNLRLEDEELKLTLPLETKSAKRIIINAELTIE